MKKLFIVSALVIGAMVARADENMNPAPAESSGFQASLTPNIAIHPQTTVIRGFSINIWGKNPQHGFDLGVVNGSTGESGGFSAAVVNYSDSYSGVQWGVVNYSTGNFNGWQEGWVNISKGTFTGWQDGPVNISHDFHGLQSGFVNYTEHLHGIQLGLVNIALNNGWFDQMPDKFARGFPFFNWSF